MNGENPTYKKCTVKGHNFWWI